MRLNKRPNFPLNKRYTSLAAAIATASVFGGLPQVSLGQESVSLIEEVVVTARKAPRISPRRSGGGDCTYSIAIRAREHSANYRY